MKDVYDAIRHGIAVLSVVLAVIFFLGLASCATKTKSIKTNQIEQKEDIQYGESHDLSSHFSISELTAGEFVIYDTSLAVDTLGGFYAPVLAAWRRQISKESEKTVIIHDTVFFTTRDTIYIFQEAEIKKKTNDGLQIGSYLFSFIFVIFLLVMYFRKR